MQVLYNVVLLVVEEVEVSTLTQTKIVKTQLVLAVAAVEELVYQTD
jgi:hypothetical protein|tara:strand:+ start:158 stop:295 length:138 start_codon:yes stop_codon:yes gene_type:complete